MTGIVDYVQSNPSSDNWRLVGSLQGIAPEVRAEARYNAAQAYMMEGRTNEAVQVYYELANIPEVARVFVDGENLKDLAAVGFELSANYAGPGVIFDTERQQAYSLGNVNTWTQIDLQAIDKALDGLTPFSAEAWSGVIAESLVALDQ